MFTHDFASYRILSSSDNMGKFILDIQFVCGNKGQYFIKELAVLTVGKIVPDTYHFLPPYPYQELSSKARRQIQYDMQNINGLRWNDGDIGYSNLPEVFSRFKMQQST